MKRLTETELAIVRHCGLTPENIGSRIVDLDLAEIATYCMHKGYPEAYDKISTFLVLERIEQKFWDNDGFDSIALESIGPWVLTTYLTYEEVRGMTNDQLIEFLQNWKYYFGFRKCEGWVENYRADAYAIWNGTLIQDPDSDEIWYIDNDETTN